MNAALTPRPFEGKTAVVVQHLAFEDLGSLGPVLSGLGFRIQYRQAGVDALSDDAATADLLVVLGGPIGAYEEAVYPFLADELSALRQRLSQNRPTLGICLGAQLMAQALGARVYPGGRKEIGWGPLSLTSDGAQSPLRHLLDTPVLHWHGDTFELPGGAQWLASSPVYPHQAFSVGPNVLALQCHPEAETARFERWLIGHSCELSHADIDVPRLRAEAAQHGPALEAACQRLFAEWLDGIHWLPA